MSLYTGAGEAYPSPGGVFALRLADPGQWPAGQRDHQSPVYQPLVEPSVSAGGFIAPPAGFGVYEVASNFRQARRSTGTSASNGSSARTCRSMPPTWARRAPISITIGNSTSATRRRLRGPTYAELQTQFGTTISVPAAIRISFPYYPRRMAISPPWISATAEASRTLTPAGQCSRGARDRNLTFTAAYTWSKLMDNINHRSIPMTNEDLDTAGWHHNNYPHVLSLTYVYALPFGHGQKFANSTSTWKTTSWAAGHSAASPGSVPAGLC